LKCFQQILNKYPITTNKLWKTLLLLSFKRFAN
jgi:hypothetical protein